MSDYRAVAAATATLQNLLTSATSEAIPGATVRTGPPESFPPHEVVEGMINIFLYKVHPNMTWRNEELPYRRADGTIIRKPQLAVDLHYLLSFYGDDKRQIPNLLLGVALSALHAEPYPNPRHMPGHGASPGGDTEGEGSEAEILSLDGSGLEEQHHPLYYNLAPLTHDELSKLWTIFSQIPYVMSVAYAASVILIEPLVVPQPALPARRAQVYFTGIQGPRLAEVDPQYLPEAAGASVELHGTRLAAEFVKVVIGETEAEPVVRDDGWLTVPLPEVPAGVHLVRVVHGERRPDVPFVHWTTGSNSVPFVLQPVIREVTAVLIQATESPAGSPPLSALEDASSPTDAPRTPSTVTQRPPGVDQRRHVRLKVHFAPRVRVATQVLLLLNETIPESGPPAEERAPHSYAFASSVEPLVGDRFEIDVWMVPATYLVRIEINRAESPLSVDSDPTSPTFERYNGPQVVVPQSP